MKVTVGAFVCVGGIGVFVGKGGLVAVSNGGSVGIWVGIADGVKVAVGRLRLVGVLTMGTAVTLAEGVDVIVSSFLILIMTAPLHRQQ